MTAERLADLIWRIWPLRILAAVLLACGLFCWLAWHILANEWAVRFWRCPERPACHGTGDVGGNAIGCYHCGGEG